MDESVRVIDCVRDVAEYIQTSEGRTSASQMLERFLFTSDMQWTYVSKLSGGEKRRLYLLRILMDAPNVLILDEPTNDLDIQTLTILEDYLDGFSGIVITVSHDRYFLDRVVRRIFAFEENGHIHQYEGGFTDYWNASEAIRSQMSAASQTDGKVSGGLSGKEAYEASKQAAKAAKLKFTYKEQKEYETIEADIAAIENQLKQLDAQIAANATNSVKLQALMLEKEATENALEEKMDRWMYLEDLAARIAAQQ